MVGYIMSEATKELAQLHRFQFIDCERSSLNVAIYGGIENDIHLPGMRFINYETSYLEDPKCGEPVAIVGYPGDNVSIDNHTADFGYYFAVLPISSKSERQVKMANEMGTRTFTDYGSTPREKISLGGLSGAPAFVIRDQLPRFIGIVTDCSDTERMVDSTVIVSRLGCLKPDGTLDHTAIAW